MQENRLAEGHSSVHPVFLNILLKGARLKTSLDEWKWGVGETHKESPKKSQISGQMNLTPACP